MVVNIFLIALSLGWASAEEPRAHSQRYLSIYATDITGSFSDYDKVKELMRKYFAARQAGAIDKLKEVASTELYGSLTANRQVVRTISINPDLLEVRDLAIYSLNKKTLVQFDIYDLGNKKTHSIKSWFSIRRESKGWMIDNILEHFDPDAGP